MMTTTCGTMAEVRIIEKNLLLASFSRSVSYRRRTRLVVGVVVGVDLVFMLGCGK